MEIMFAFIATNPKARRSKSLKMVFISVGEVAMEQRERERQKSKVERDSTRRRERTKGRDILIALRWVWGMQGQGLADAVVSGHQ